MDIQERPENFCETSLSRHFRRLLAGACRGAAAGIRGISSTAAAPGGNYNEFERIFSVWHIETQK
jgi:hypothetical protein